MIEIRRWAVGLWKTLTSPMPRTFMELGRMGEEIPIASLVVLSFTFLVFYLVGVYTAGITISIIDMILTMITGVLVITFWVAIIHFLYLKTFHRKEVVFNQLLFVCVDTFIVTQSVGILIWFIPIIGEVSDLITAVYLVALMTSAVMGVTRLSFGRSAVIVIISLPITIIFVFFIYSLLTTVPRVLRGI
jgi:hypothetical protein